MKINTAFIMCAGYGKRLNPLTLKIPKPLLEINDLTLLENTINLIKDLNEIIGFIDQLNEVNTDNVDPLSSVTGHDLPLRKDKVIDGEINDRILENAPEKISGYFVVPKVVE